MPARIEEPSGGRNGAVQHHERALLAVRSRHGYRPDFVPGGHNAEMDPVPRGSRGYHGREATVAQ